jgi:solute carrier family 25 oxoglutarate transporter 11
LPVFFLFCFLYSLPALFTCSVEGISACYAGLSAALFRQATYGTARIGLHRSFSDYLVAQNNGKPVSFAAKTASGLLSGSMAVCVGTPFDVALVRMQADSMQPVAQRRNYSGVINALVRINQEEGFKKLFSGLTPNILRGATMNAGMMSCYDQAKEMIGNHITHDPNLNNPLMSTRLGSSAVAGFTAAAFSLPFDLIKSRIQNDPKRYVGVLDAGRKILSNEGVFAFWTGFGAFYGRCAPHVTNILPAVQQSFLFSICHVYLVHVRP